MLSQTSCGIWGWVQWGQGQGIRVKAVGVFPTNLLKSSNSYNLFCLVLRKIDFPRHSFGIHVGWGKGWSPVRAVGAPDEFGTRVSPG